jgi:DNA polymerase III delta prime subunit
MPNPIPVMVFGYPGIGKSYTVEAVAKELGLEYIQWSLGRAEAYDIKGVPDILGKFMEWKLPKIYDDINTYSKQGKRVLLHLDEATLMAPDVQGAILDLVLLKRVDNYKLPEDLIIVLSGNIGDEDGTYARALTSALTGGRCMSLTLIPPTVEEWIAYQKPIPDLAVFLRQSTHSLFEGPNKERPSEPWTCPRAWSRFDTWCKHNKLNAKRKEQFISEAEMFLSGVTVIEMQDFFDKSSLNVESLINLDLPEWKKFAEAKESRQTATLREVVRSIFETKEASLTEKLKSMQKMLDQIEQHKIKEETITSFISFAMKYNTGRVLEELTYKKQKVGDRFDVHTLGNQ